MNSNDSEAGDLGKSYIKNMFIFSLMLIPIGFVLLRRGEEVQPHTIGPAWEIMCGGLMILTGVSIFLQIGCVTIFRLLKSQLQKSS